MKGYVKRILTALLSVIMIVSVLGINVFAAEPIRGSFVEFTDDGTTKTATAFLRNPEGGEASVDTWFFLAAYVGNTLTNVDMQTLTLEGGKENFVTASVPMTSGAAYKAYVWYKDLCMPITELAVDGYTSDALLTGITVDGVLMEDFDPEVTEYTRTVGPDGVVPITKGIVADNSIYTTTRYVDSEQDFKAVVTAEDSTGKTQKYTINYTAIEYDTSNGYNAWHAVTSYTTKIKETDSSEIESKTFNAEFIRDNATSDGYCAISDVTIGAIDRAGGALLCSNLHGNPDPADETKSGARWVTDEAPLTTGNSGQGHQLFTVPDLISGLDFFVFNNGKRASYYTAGTTMVEFTLDKSAEVVIYTQSTDNTFEGFSTPSTTADNIAAYYKEGSFINNTNAKFYDSNGDLTITGPFNNTGDFTWAKANELNHTDWIKGNYVQKNGVWVEQTKDNTYSNNMYDVSCSKTYTVEKGSTANVSVKIENNLVGRSPIIVIKPVATEVEPLISDYTNIYGGMTLDQFCEATGKTRNPNFTPKVEGNIKKVIKTNAIRTVTLDTDGDPTIDSKGPGSGKGDGDPTFDPAIIDNNFDQRYLKTIESVSGIENAFFTATDREMTAINGGENTWDAAIFYAMEVNEDGDNATSPQYPLTEMLTEDLLWSTFKVNRPCEVLIFSCRNEAASPNFLKKPENGWTKLNNSKKYFTAERGNAYGAFSGSSVIEYQTVYSKEFEAGETVQLYNSGNSAGLGEELPYMTVVRFK